jgi:hypothetical protein
MNAANVSAQADQLGRKADNSTILDHAVRVGLVAYGLVHLLIGFIAVRLAFGDSSGSASTNGALRQLAQAPLGGVLLIAVAAGFAALVVWQLIEAALGHREYDGGKRVAKRVGSVLKAVLYGALGWSALDTVTGAGQGGGGGGGTDSTTAKLMSMPGGPYLVAAVGVGVVGYALRQVYKGLSEGFTENLDVDGCTGGRGRTIVTLGKVGYVAKGLALFIVGGLFIWAAFTHDPKKSGGLDQALHQVLQQPFGVPMLVVLGLGIAAFGVYAFGWARHLDR